MKKQTLITSIGAGLIALGLASTADAALVGRLAATSGGMDYQAYYDTDADLTWLADANAAGAIMTWAAANTWAADLDVAGVTGWRLANTNPVNGTAFNYSFTNNGSTDLARNISRSGTAHAGSQGSELANLFYNVLGNVSDYDSSGTFDDGCVSSCLTNTGPFSNVQSNVYWSASEFALNTRTAWDFSMSNGVQGLDLKDTTFYGWAVQSGDVSAVPVPAAVWLFGSGLLGLIGVARRKKT